MIAAIVRKAIGFIQRFELVQVVRLHSALRKSNMQVHNLKKAGEGRYLVRVSVSPRGATAMQKVTIGKTSPFAGSGLIGKVTGNRERIANEDRFADYFAEAMNSQAIDLSNVERDIENGIESYDDSGLAVYTEFSSERRIATRKVADWGLRAMLRNFGCDVEDAEMVSDAGYGSQWIAVAFAAA
jgi:uncharacterized protein YeeX (DUF496 family)